MQQSINLKDKTVLIYDYGLCTEIAKRLAQDFKKVYYYAVWESAFPKSNLALVGTGIEGVERIRSFDDYIDKVDLICFFDTYNADKVMFLRKHGYRVFGAGEAEIIENNRWKARKYQQKVGLPTQETVKIVGVEALIEYLKKNDNKYVKINSFRGDIETFHHDTYDETEAQYLGTIMVETGAKGKTLEFIIEETLEGVEPGYDGWVVDGVYPEIAMWGYEKKGAGYIGKVDLYKNMFAPMREINDKLAPAFKKAQARTFFSSEFLSNTKDKAYLIDPCVRLPMPVGSAVHTEIWKNFSEIVWYASEGKAIKPIPVAKYGAGLAFESEWAKDHWTHVDFPPKLRQWIKLRMAFKTDDNKYYALPGMTSIASVIGLGNTVKEAVDLVKERAKQVKAAGISYTFEGLDDIMAKVIPEGEKLGLKF